MEAGTITRRMNLAMNGLDQEFQALYTRKDFEEKIRELRAAGKKSSRPSILSGLFRMFDICGVSYERRQSNEYYEELVRKADLPDFHDIEDKMIYALFCRYQQYPSPEEYMKRMVDRMSSEREWADDTLRLRILKQFIKYGNYLHDADFGGRLVIQKYVREKCGLKKKPSEEEVLLQIDDHIFDMLGQGTKAQKKPQGKFGLLKLADDLALGQFRAQGATRRGLYLFAIVYGMSYYSGASDEIIDYSSDLEKNLFKDYYSNNLMRYISDVYRGKLCEYYDPSGMGINYKNFAEMIYLYYICRDYTPQDKIRLSHEMIERVSDMQYHKGKSEISREGEGTLYYRGMYRKDAAETLFSEDVLNLTEEEFEEFLCENYDCDTYIEYETKKGKIEGKASVMTLETEQNTAYENYRNLLRSMEEIGVTLENCNYGLWFTDAAFFRNEEYKEKYLEQSDMKGEEFEEFLQLLWGINSFLGNTLQEENVKDPNRKERTDISRVKTKALYVQGPETVSRTSMIVAYYYYYNTLHEEDDYGQWKSFQEHYSNFKQGIDEFLEASYYQPLDGKNIFDVMIVFSSYAYLNL